MTRNETTTQAGERTRVMDCCNICGDERRHHFFKDHEFKPRPAPAENYPVEVLTGKFENAHMRKPRGTGRWWFNVSGRHDRETQFYFDGKYSDAAKAAQAKARETGVRFVVVLP